MTVTIILLFGQRWECLFSTITEMYCPVASWEETVASIREREAIYQLCNLRITTCPGVGITTIFTQYVSNHKILSIEEGGITSQVHRENNGC